MGGTVLTPGEAAAILFGVFFLLIVLRVPVAFSLGLACLPILAIEPRLSIMSLAQETFNAYNSFILLAVPFFLLTANLMTIGGITDRLVTLSRTMVGHWPGSLAQINVVLSVFFAGISGSSTADAASQSKIFIDAQTNRIEDDVDAAQRELVRRAASRPTRPRRSRSRCARRRRRRAGRRSGTRSPVEVDARLRSPAGHGLNQRGS